MKTIATPINEIFQCPKDKHEVAIPFSSCCSRPFMLCALSVGNNKEFCRDYIRDYSKLVVYCNHTKDESPWTIPVRREFGKRNEKAHDKGKQ